MPRLVRDRLLSRLARTHTRLPLTSFLASPNDRLGAHRRPGGHYVETTLSRRNHTKVVNPSETVKQLCKFLVDNVDDFELPLQRNKHIIEILAAGRSGVRMNGQPIRISAWFKCDSTTNNAVYPGKLVRMFLIPRAGTRSGHEVVVYIQRFKMRDVHVQDTTDYIVDSNARSSIEVLPLKSLSAMLWPVQHPELHEQQKVWLLFLKDL